MYAVPGELASAFFFFFGPFHVIAASQILINYSRSEIDAIFFSFFFFLPASHAMHSLSPTIIFTINIIMSWAHSLKWPLANTQK